MSDMCNDNRFELIEKYKKELIESTNIETRPDEMAVLDDILFRFWQMGWLEFDYGRDLQIAYDEGYRKGRYDEKVYLADCISRAEAIKVASGYCHPANIADELRKLPPAQPEWISVKDRLPEDEYVLISKKPTKILGDKWSVAIAIRTADPRSGKIEWRDSGFGVIQDDKVLAWMPMPEPYEGVEE